MIFRAVALLAFIFTSTASADDLVIDRAEYQNRLEGFWLAQSIANWTGLLTEGDRNEAPFYTDANWGQVDQPNTWGGYRAYASKLDYFLVGEGQVWGADDDTDIEYIWQALLERSDSAFLTGEQIRDGWLTHIWTNEDAPLSHEHFGRENFSLGLERERSLSDEGPGPRAARYQ